MKSFRLALLASLVLAACTWPLGGGVVQGVVYGDLNGNASIESGEGPLEGVDVTLTECGPNLTQTTAADGAFHFSNLPAGSCLVQAAKAGWAFSGSFPSLGYPIPVASDPNLPTSFSIFMAPQASCTNVLDITFSTPLQKTYMAPGQAFVMSWTVVNQGTCTWGDGYHLVFEGGPSPSEGGSSMGAPLDIPLSSLVTIPVLPGQQVVINLNQTAPMQAGWYVGSWKLVAPNGDTMPNVCLCTDIVVKVGGSIGGMVWHDLCALPDGPLPPAPPPGCTPSGGSYEANGVLEAGEPGLAGVTLRLGSGNCPSSGLATAVTGPDGTYSLPGLVSGDYCVSVGALIDGNDTILIPGGWTAPVAHVDPQAVSVSLSEGQAYTGLNFGWDYQFLPAWTAPTPTVAMQGFSSPQSSSDMFYYRGVGCGPKEIDLSVQATYPNLRNVVLFFRLKDKSGGETTAWNDGVAMMPQGGGLFNFTLASETIPGFTSYAEAFLQYQFVAEGAGGAILGRTQVFSDVELSVCHQ